MNTDTLPTPTADEAAGLRLLGSKARTLHPRAQVQSLRKSAVIALGKADRTRRYSGDHAAAARFEEKARLATEAMLYLNRAHGLGYPVPR